MAYDDYLNKDKGLRGGAMDAPDLQVRIAQAKIAANAAHLLTAKEWRRIAERQRLEQESRPMAMTASEQANRARAAMNVGLPRFTQQELMAANQPGTVPAPQEFKVQNIPGRGESTVVQGVEIQGGPLKTGGLPVPQEGYGYVMGPSGYISTTPYGMQRGATPQLGDVEAVEQPVAQVSPAYPESAGFPFALSTFEKEANRPSVLPTTGYAAANEILSRPSVPVINIPPTSAQAARYAAVAGGGGFVGNMGNPQVPTINIPQEIVPTINIPPSSSQAARYGAAAGGGGFVYPMGGSQVPTINIPQEIVPTINIPPSYQQAAQYGAAAGGGGFVTPMNQPQSFIGNMMDNVSARLSQRTAIYPKTMARNAAIATQNAIYGKPEAKMINIPQEKPEAKMINIPREQVPIINIDEAQGVPVSRPEAKMINIPQEKPEAKMISIPQVSGKPALTTDILGISSYGKQRVSPDIVANQLLGTPLPTQQKPPAKMINIPQEVAPALPSNIAPPSDMTVSPVIPEGITGQAELEAPVFEQPSFQQMEAPAQFPTYRPPELKIQPFNVGQIMKQPSVSETLAMGPALRAYQAQTQAQIAAYKANVSAQRNALKDSIDAQLKGVDIQKKQADLISTQIANQFATGGPQAGLFNVGDKTLGYIRTGPNSIQKIDLKPNQSAAEANYEFRVKANSEIAKRIKSGDTEGAAIMYQSLGGKPEDFTLFSKQFQNESDVQETKAAVKPTSTPKQSTNQGSTKVGKYLVTPAG
jgi:hypothetical protein